MSLVKEARERLLSDDERYSGVAVTECAGCHAPAYEDPEDPDGPGDIDHRAGCRIALLERIVAALEAAEALLWAAHAVDSLPRSVVFALDDLEIALGAGQTSEEAPA